MKKKKGKKPKGFPNLIFLAIFIVHRTLLLRVCIALGPHKLMAAQLTIDIQKSESQAKFSAQERVPN